MVTLVWAAAGNTETHRIGLDILAGYATKAGSGLGRMNHKKNLPMAGCRSWVVGAPRFFPEPAVIRV